MPVCRSGRILRCRRGASRDIVFHLTAEIGSSMECTCRASRRGVYTFGSILPHHFLAPESTTRPRHEDDSRQLICIFVLLEVGRERRIEKTQSSPKRGDRPGRHDTMKRLERVQIDFDNGDLPKWGLKELEVVPQTAIWGSRN